VLPELPNLPRVLPVGMKFSDTNSDGIGSEITVITPAKLFVSFKT